MSAVSLLKHQRSLAKNCARYGLFTRFYSIISLKTLPVFHTTKSQRTHKISNYGVSFSLIDSCAFHSSQTIRNDLELKSESNFNYNSSQLDIVLKDAPESAIVVRNIAPSITKEQFLSPFKNIDQIVSFDLDTRSRGFGFIYFKNPESAQRAINALNGVKLKGPIPCKIRLFQKEKEEMGTDIIYIKGIESRFLNQSKELKAFLEKYGKVKSTYISDIPSGNTNEKTWPKACFVQYETKEQASNAFNAINYHILDKKVLVVQYKTNFPMDRSDASHSIQQPNTKSPSIWVGNLPYEIPGGEIISFFKQFGRTKIVQIPSNHTTGQNKGYGFVTFESVTEANEAVLKLNGCPFQGRSLIARIYDSDQKTLDRSRKASIKSLTPTKYIKTPGLYIGNISHTISGIDEKIRELFRKYGTIKDVYFPRGSGFDSRKNICFLRYETIDEATAAIKGMDNHYFNGRILRVRYLQPKVGDWTTDSAL